MLYDKDGDLGLLKGKTVAVIGFGSQGHAHSQNLRDSGVEVVVAEAPGTAAWDRAAAAGFEVMTADAAAALADVIMMVVPDQTQKVVYESAIRDNLKDGDMLMFAHGFNIHYNQIVPPKGVDVTMVAPKGPGHLVRRVYTEGGGVPALVAVYQDATGKARDRALAYAKGIGALRAGRHRDHLQRRDRDRPVRRAGRALRRGAASSSAPASRPWSRPAISPKWPTSSACTS